MALLTYEDYCHIPQDGRRYEVVHGSLYMSPSPVVRHQKIIGRIFKLLDEYASIANAGEVIIAPLDVILSDNDIVQPDVIFISKDRLSIVTEKNIQGAPDLLVEVLSEGNRRHDEVVKRKLYEQHLVKEYWIVDPELETVKVFRLGETAFEHIAIFESGTDRLVRSPLLSGFSCKADAIFRDHRVDRRADFDFS